MLIGIKVIQLSQCQRYDDVLAYIFFKLHTWPCGKTYLTNILSAFSVILIPECTDFEANLAKMLLLSHLGILPFMSIVGVTMLGMNTFNQTIDTR